MSDIYLAGFIAPEEKSAAFFNLCHKEVDFEIIQ